MTEELLHCRSPMFDEEENILEAHFDSVLEYNGRLLFFERDTMGLWSSDRVLNTACFLRYAKKDVSLKKFVPTGIFRYQSSVCIGNLFGLQILIYDLDKKIFSQYRFDSIIDKNARIRIFQYAHYKRWIYVFPPKLSEGYFIFDIDEKIFNHHPAISRKREEIIKFIWQEESVVYFPIYDSQIIYKLNLEDGGVDIIRLGIDRKLMMTSVCTYKDDIYMIFNNNATMGRYHQGNYEEILLEDIDAKDLFSKIYPVKDYIAILPRNYNCMYLFNVSSGNIKRVDIDTACDFTKQNGSLCVGYYFDENKIYLLPWEAQHIFCYDLLFDSMKSYKINMQPNMDFLDKEELFMENKEFGLSDYICALGKE